LVDFINQCPSHSVIILQSQKITDQDIDIIVQYAIQDKKCSILDLNSNHITYQGAIILSKALINNITLEQLYLTNNSIFDQGIQSLAQVLSNENRSLKKLGLELNNITDEGVEYLSTMFKTNRTLIHLGLSANKISNYGVKLLANELVDDETALEELHLSGNKSINDECMDYLIDLLSHNQSIKILTLRDCNLSVEGKTQLRTEAEKKTNFILIV
jgi:Ran GTPase-activating protein (RanGAP) involved in mRNA processing and transport